MTRKQLYRSYPCGALTFDDLKECDCSEHPTGEAFTDDIGCGYKPCTGCLKKWFFCGFCKQDDFETEEELTEHVSEIHPDMLDPGSMFAPDGDGPED